MDRHARKNLCDPPNMKTFRQVVGCLMFFVGGILLLGGVFSDSLTVMAVGFALGVAGFFIGDLENLPG